jgi:hypothetical protein
MPILKTSGDDLHDVTWTLAVMLWPDPKNQREREQFYAAKTADHLLRAGLVELTLPAEQVAALLDAPGWPALTDEVVKRTKRATVAGHVFLLMFIMDLCKERLPRRGDPGASLDKAIAVMEAWASMDKRFGDDSRFPLSDRTIRNYWDEFRCVAHLWAAKDLNLDPAFQFAPKRGVLQPENLHSLLCVAGQLAHFGCNFRLANKSREKVRFLLDCDAIWVPDPNLHPPSMKAPENLDIFDNSAFMKILRAYQA